MTNYEDGVKIYIDKERKHYLMIFDYDIRFYKNDGCNHYIMEINTYPNKPNNLIDLIYSINIFI